MEILEIQSPEDMATLLKNELKNHGFAEQDDGTMARRDGDVTVTVDPCSGEVTVKAETQETVSQKARRDAIGFNDVGPNENNLRDRVRDQLKQNLDKKFEQEQTRLQTKGTEELEKHLQEIQPEISQIVNQVTRDPLKQKGQQMVTVSGGTHYAHAPCFHFNEITLGSDLTRIFHTPLPLGRQPLLVMDSVPFWQMIYVICNPKHTAPLPQAFLPG